MKSFASASSFLLLAALAPSPAIARQSTLVALPEGRLLGTNTFVSQGYARALSVSGASAVVGVEALQSWAGASGGAYVYVHGAQKWSQQARLLNSDAVHNARFGYAVAIDGDRIAVGAPNMTANGFVRAGAVYVFERSGSDWIETARITGTGGDKHEFMGWSLALQGTTLAAGAADEAPPMTGATSNGGAVYVFELVGSSWVQQARLTASDGDPNDNFSRSIELDGDRLVAGAWRNQNGSIALGGSAYVFDRVGSTWTQTAQLVPGDNAAQDGFGFAVALAGDALAVGAQRADAPGMTDAGAVYVYELGASGWTQVQKIQATPAAPTNFFGGAVEFAQGRLWITNPWVTGGTSALAPSVQLFERSSSGWTKTFDVRSDIADLDSSFGHVFGISGDNLLVGAPYDDPYDTGNHVGAVYSFTLERAVASYCAAKVNSLGCTPAMEWTGGASVSSALPFDVRARNVLDHKLGLLAYGYGASNAPFQGGTLCVEAPLTRTPAQDSGGSGAGNCSGVYGFDFNALIQSGADPELVAGVQVFAQYWSRDPQASFTTGLTDALRFYVQP